MATGNKCTLFFGGFLWFLLVFLVVSMVLVFVFVPSRLPNRSGPNNLLPLIWGSHHRLDYQSSGQLTNALLQDIDVIL